MKYLTKEGFEKLKQELEERKSQIRQEIASSIKEAKEQGDLSENAEYAEAKSQQRENESRIMQLENILRTSKVMDKKNGSKMIDFGSVIDVECHGKKMTFEIVGSNEANPIQGKISNESPIGRAFIGKGKDSKVEVNLPNGKKVEYKIISIR
jgi:transcription elongation factor GreA